ncbi:O-antigen translocase [Shewanella baltica]|uniref:O-antigen translocase n=1 Tax=Shewanella baltica TaxID=62322 RepID=UPI00398558AD
MTLIKTSLLNAIAVIIKLITLLGLNKLLAIYVGPTGYVALGQFQNAIQMITTFASGALNTGVVKYTASYNGDELKQRAIWQTAGTVSVVGGVLTGAVVIFFSKSLAIWFLNDESLSVVFVWFSVMLVFFLLNTLLLAILNGKKEIKRYVVANICGSALSLTITGLLVMYYGLYGALVGFAIYQSFAFFATFFICYKTSWFDFSYLFGRIDRESVVNLSKYTAMALTGAVCVPASLMYIRNNLAETLTLQDAGYWEAMWRLSSAYLMIITTILSVYFLPRFSELNNMRLLKKEVVDGFKIIIPFTALAALFIFLTREYSINILFTSDFAEMSVLFPWQVIGDIFKVASFIVGYVFLSKAKYKLFMFIEVYFAFQFCLLVHFLVPNYGLEGASMAYMINYVICFVFVSCVFFFKKEFL